MLDFKLPEILPCLVAFSGGADSRLLLELTVRALLERDGEVGRRQVLAAHLHHGIRGAEADRDLAFCQRVCAELGVELISERADVPALAAASGESLETAARRVRYDFFERVMAERKIRVLMTAHHADDNLETVLERLLRGSGTRGMGGIPPLRRMGGWNGYPQTLLYRPLLEWTRRDILSACSELGLDYVTDSTNMENDSLRNRLRHSVIPELEAIAGKDVPQRSAARMSRHLREDDGFLTSMAERRVYSTHTPFGDGMRADDLADLSPVVAKRVFMLLYRNAVLTHTRGERQGSLSAAHLEELLEFTRKGIPEARLMLPEGMMALIREEYLLILPAEPPEALPPIPTEAVPLRDGITDWHDRVYVMLERFPAPAAPLEGEWVLASAVFPGDIPHPLVARKRQDGDRILSHGMHKRLKKLLQEKGVPVYVRDRIPLVCLWDGSPGGEPFWYPTVAFRDGYPPPAEGPCLRITFAHRDTLRPEK